ncbi:MAG: AAA family ATPase [Myxococcales bacterium]|nr:AAA family ATPase [Myxococcales bacterium]
MFGTSALFGAPFYLDVQWDAPTALGGEWRASKQVAAFLSDDRMGGMTPVEQFRRLDLARRSPQDRVSPDFHQYLVNQHIQRAVRREKAPDDAARITRELTRLEEDLAYLFERPGLRFELDDQHWQVDLVEPGQPPISWAMLAAGHRSVLQMLAELVLRIDATGRERDDPELSGVVVIDEVELHLHPSLQEKVLPFLTSRFPRLQFIAATHSPAVISSIDGALVVDLRDGRQVPSEDLRGVRYGDLMTAHFGIATDYDLDSTRKMARLHALWHQGSRTADEESEMRSLVRELSDRSHALALDIEMRLGEPG